MSEQYAVKFLCELLDVNRSGYYKWKARKGQLNRYEQDREDLTCLLLEAHKKHKTYGYHRLATLIRNETGWVFSDNLAHKCCKHAKIKAKGRKTYNYRKGTENIHFPNTVNGNWNANRPMQIVASDMTVLGTKNGTKYEWTYILDTFNNEIIASSLSKRTGDPKPYFDCLNTLIQKLKKQTEPTVLHTDQGSVYSSRAFREAHANCTSLLRSMSRSGTPTDNPVIESINGWIKEELYIDFGLWRCENVPELIENYIKYFNNERISSKCKGKTPVQYRTELGY